MNNYQLVIITGLSGSGKTLTSRCFEDLGYYCVDNLPVKLIPTFIDLCSKTTEEIAKIALVIDIRERDFLGDFDHVYGELKRSYKVKLIFLEASDEVLIRRYSESRRPHPLSPDNHIIGGIQRERQILQAVRQHADLIIDTSKLSVHELKNFIIDNIEGEKRKSLLLSIVSFGYKFGIPYDSDLVFDIRFLPNPFFTDELRDKNGLHKEVDEYVASDSHYKEFIEKVESLLLFLIPHYIEEGKTYLTISIGCTGGRHRSVVVANKIKDILYKHNYKVKLVHRDIDKE
ncbi:RNase adaptor protein RapZ [bacterium (candidate division B38) B3_B38]|nr:MAG: RNase adaptor protein RapZ [bacterium (candidate division B38) B3_B38]